MSATRGRQWNVFASTPAAGVGEFYAANPEFDPVITYFVRDGGSSAATIAIRDAAGSVVRTLTGTAGRGLNTVTWDMHMDPAIPTRVVLGAGRGGGGRGGVGSVTAGPLVLPGTYSVSIRIPGLSRELHGDVTVVADPMDPTTSAERRARQVALLDLYAGQKTLSQAATRGHGGQGDSLNKVIDAEVERLFGVTATLMRSIEGFSGGPTPDQRQQIAWTRADVAHVAAIINRTGSAKTPSSTAAAVRRPH